MLPATSTLSADRRRRLRWRARRGLLENDIMLTRFLDAREATLSESDVEGLDELLEMTDNELMDFLLGRREPQSDQLSASAIDILAQIRIL
jgi:antitoxin CptB